MKRIQFKKKNFNKKLQKKYFIHVVYNLFVIEKENREENKRVSFFFCFWTFFSFFFLFFFLLFLASIEKKIIWFSPDQINWILKFFPKFHEFNISQYFPIFPHIPQSLFKINLKRWSNYFFFVLIIMSLFFFYKKIEIIGDYEFWRYYWTITYFYFYFFFHFVFVIYSYIHFVY